MALPLERMVVSQPKLEPEKTLADLLIDYLSQLSVEYVFGIPGGAIEPLYNALARSARRGGPRPLVSRHESGAAFMADGYYRETGRLGVCCSTTGPGATNLITGVASAYENRIPMLVITAQTALSFFGKGAFQESSCTGINTVSMFDHCTRFSTLVSHPNQFEHKLINAIMAAFRSPSGPVHLSIPWDVFNSRVINAAPAYNISALLAKESLLDISGIDSFYEQIFEAKKIVFVVGAGCGEAIDKILELATMVGASIVATPHGKGFVNPYHPLFRGIIGFAGHKTARETLTDPAVDTVVAIGSNFSEWASNAWDDVALLNNRLIHVDFNEDHFARSPMARLHVRGRISVILSAILDKFKRIGEQEFSISICNAPDTSKPKLTYEAHPSALNFRIDSEAAFLSESKPIKPQSLMRALVQYFPLESTFLADTGNSQAWSVHYLHPKGLGSVIPRTPLSARFQASFEFSSMGWAIGASIGMALGSKNRHPVVCITGDGSLLMNGQEITVAVQESLPVVFVILNDSALGMVKHGQNLAGSESVAIQLPNIDYCAFAKALGADAFVIHSASDFENLDIASICQKSGPTLLDVRINSDEVPPIGMRMRVLGNTI